MDVTAPSPTRVSLPQPGSEEECRRFGEIQKRLASLFRTESLDSTTVRTTVVVPSLSFDIEELMKIRGVGYYEERLLCLLMLLLQPRTRLIYLSSRPIAEAIVDYYLRLLPGIPAEHARTRLTLLSCHDGSSKPLTEKLLERPRLLERVRATIPDAAAAHMLCFNSTPLERSLAVRLDIPMYACDPRLARLGTKSGSREVFRQAGVALPYGFENLRDSHDLARALADLKQSQPALRRAVIKLNEGFSGIGNAVFSYESAPERQDLIRWIEAELSRRIQFEATDESWESYSQKLARMGGIAEALIERDGHADIRSPSVQCQINPLDGVEILSTHDQVLGGPLGQVYLGCSFPANPAYSRSIQEAGERVAEVLRQKGVLGRFGIDFVSTRRGDRWEHAAVEINLRMGGTTHPYMMLQALTGGGYDTESGMHLTSTGQPRYYFASDNLHSPAYRGLTPQDLMDIVEENELRFNSASQQGVMFHLIGALSEHGKLGMVCIDDSPTSTQTLYRQTLATLDREARRGTADSELAITI